MSFWNSLQQVVSDAGTSIVNVGDTARRLVGRGEEQGENETENTDLLDTSRSALPPRAGCPLVVPEPTNDYANTKGVEGNQNSFFPRLYGTTNFLKRVSTDTVSPQTSLDQDFPTAQRTGSLRDNAQNFFNTHGRDTGSLDTSNGSTDRFNMGKSSQSGTKDDFSSKRKGRSVKGSTKNSTNISKPSCFIEMPQRWAEVTDTRSGVADVDNEFLELYGGLQSHHEEKRQQHFAESAEEMQYKTASSNSISTAGNDANSTQANNTSNSNEKIYAPSDTIVGIETVELKISEEEKIEVYKEVLYTITHKIGTGGARQGPGGGHSAASTGLQASPSKTNQQLPLLLKDELYSYARNAFGFSMPGHRKLLSLTAEQKPPIVVLNVIVIEAEGLEAKDINGYSDPYCMLGILPADLPNKKVPLDDGGIYCGDDPEDSNNTSGVIEAVPKITIAAGSSISITIAGDSSIGTVSTTSDLLGNTSTGSTQDVQSSLIPMVGQGIPVQRTSSVLATKGSFKRNRKNGDITETKKQQEHFPKTGLLEKPSENDQPHIKVNDEEAKDGLSSLTSLFPKPQIEKTKKRGSFRLSFRKSTKSGNKKEKDRGSGNEKGLSSEGKKSSDQGSKLDAGNGLLGANLDNTGNYVFQGGFGKSFSGALPAKFIRTTSVRPKTLSPVWNERFRFDCDNFKTDMLHLDIWDHDVESSVFDAVGKLNEVKGMRGLCRYFKEVAQSARSGEQDDFLGSVTLPVHQIPPSGVEMWFKLEGRSERSNIQGSVKLRLWLSTREDRGLSEEEDLKNEVKQQRQIFTVLLLSHLESFKDKPWEWDGTLPEAACTILHQHVIQGDLTDTQTAAQRWRALYGVVRSSERKASQLSFKVLYEALCNLEARWKHDPYVEEEKELAKSLNDFIAYGLILIEHHRVLFPPRKRLASTKLDYLLRCFLELKEMRVYHRFCFERVDIIEDVKDALRKGTTQLFNQNFNPVSIEVELQVGSHYRKVLEKFIHILIVVSADLEVGLHHYQHPFYSILHVPYFSIIYTQYDKLFSEELCPLIQQTCSVRALLNASSLLPPVEYNGIHDDDIFLGDGSRVDDIGNNDKNSTTQNDGPPHGYRPFRRGSIRDMITSLSSFAGGSNTNEGFSTDESGRLTTGNTVLNQSITVPMPKPSQIQKEKVFEDPYNRNIPSLTLSYSDSSLNDHHLAFCLFEVCLGLREFSIQKGNLPVKERRKNPNLPVSLVSYHDWFLSGFTIWINITAKQVRRRVKKTVDFDVVMNSINNPDMRHTSSCRDVTSAFFYIKDFWNQLGWSETISDPTERAPARPHLAAVVKILTQNAVLYTDMIYKRHLENVSKSSESNDILEAEEQMRSPLSLLSTLDELDQVFMTVNNIAHVHECIVSLPEELGFSEPTDQESDPTGGPLQSTSSAGDSFEVCDVDSDPNKDQNEKLPQWALSADSSRRNTEKIKEEEEEEQPPRRITSEDETSNEYLQGLLDTASSDMKATILKLLEIVPKKLSSGMKKHMFHLACSPENLPTCDAIKPLIVFLEDRIARDVNGRLLRDNYNRCLHVVWESVLLVLKENADDPSNEKTLLFYNRFHEAVLILLEFFRNDGQGLSGELLITPTYTNMELMFSLHKLTTDNLIDHYHQERLNECQQLMEDGTMHTNPNQYYGILTTRIYFSNDCLFVEILSARDVVPLDNNGLSDPFVVVDLLPKRIFFDYPAQQTEVQKRSLNPVFEESFEFAASTQQCHDKNAMIQFSVFDKDIITSDDFGGEAFYPLSAVPGVASANASVGNYHGLKKIHMPLTFQQDKENPILAVLETRTQDKIAQEFVKRQRQRIIPSFLE